MIEAVASAMPSMMPTVSVEAPSTLTRYSGSSAWIISEEESMNSETRPSAQTLPGISRQRRRERGFAGMASYSLTSRRLRGSLGRLFLLRRGEALVEGFVLLGHLDSSLGGAKRAPCFFSSFLQRSTKAFVPIMSM